MRSPREVFAVCVIDEGERSIGKKSADQFGLRLHDIAVTLFALLKTDVGFTPSLPLDQKGCYQCRLHRQYSYEPYDAAAIALPKGGLFVQDLSVLRQSIFRKIPALQFSPVEG